VEEIRVPPFSLVRSIASSPPEVFVFMMLPLSRMKSVRMRETRTRQDEVGRAIFIGISAEECAVDYARVVLECMLWGSRIRAKLKA
jgi:hypothetical protein